MTATTDNRGPQIDARRTTHFKWSEFDALPKLMRDLINYSPVPVGTGFVFRQIREGMDLEYVGRLAVQRWRGYARRDALQLYGADHPQAQ